MKSIVVTGASGFVGKNLVKYLLNNNYLVQPLSMRTTEWKEGLNKSADAIIHLAGKAHATKYTANKIEYFEVNTKLTKEIFDYFRNSEIKDFFYFSSVAAVAEDVENVLIEDVAPNPNTPYGKSKLYAEKYIQSIPLPNDKRFFIIRPCMIHGPGNKGNLNLLYNVVNLGMPWPLGAYHNKRTFLSIDNLNYLIDQMLNNPNVESGIYNFADDHSLSTNELVGLIADGSNSKLRLWNVNKGFINFVATLGDKIKIPLNTERLRKLTGDFIVSNNKIKQALNIEKLPISAEKGITKTIKYFNSRNK